MRILIIDDDALQRELYEKALRQFGEVKCASGGDEALDYDWTRFDVVVLDLLMPEMSGDQVFTEATKRHGDNLPPVVVFTASSRTLLDRLEDVLSRAIVVQKSGSAGSVLQTLRNSVLYATSYHSAKI